MMSNENACYDIADIQQISINTLVLDLARSGKYIVRLTFPARLTGW